MQELSGHARAGLQYVMPPGKIQDKLFADFYRSQERRWSPQEPGLIHSASFEAVSATIDSSSNKRNNIAEYLIFCQNTKTLEKSWETRDSDTEKWLAVTLFLNPWTPEHIRKAVNAHVFRREARLAETITLYASRFIFVSNSKTELWFLECPTEIKDLVYKLMGTNGKDAAHDIPFYASNLFYYPDAEELGDKHIDDSWVRLPDWNSSFVKNHEWCEKLTKVTEDTPFAGFFDMNSSIPSMIAPYLLRGEEEYGLPKDLDPVARNDLGRELFQLLRDEDGSQLDNDLVIWAYEGCFPEDPQIVFDIFASGANWYYTYKVVQGFLEVFSVDDVEMWDAFLQMFFDSRGQLGVDALAATLKAACA